MNKDEIIKLLDLEPHPEGGYFKALDTSEIKYLDTNQTLYSSIVFLLSKNDVSHLHVLNEDELWYYQGGEETLIYEIDEAGKLNEIHLGLGKDKHIQYLVKKGKIFGSTTKGEYSLVGCLVSPSFTYEHFKLISEDELPKMSKEDYEKIKNLIIKK